MSKKKLLWVSHAVPYDAVPHAGGKIHNFYLKGIKKIDDFDIKLLTFAHYYELDKIDLDDYGIDYKLIIHHHNGLKHLFWGSLNRVNLLNPFRKDGSHVTPYVEYSVKKELKALHDTGYKPDIIVLQWTNIVLREAYVKDLFPDTPIVSIEEDVTFLSFQRKYQAETNSINAAWKRNRYNRLKKTELKCLRESDLVILNNYKDYKLLLDEGLKENLWVWCPYFQSFIDAEYIGDRKDILYYGAMGRPENWKSAIWFLENVWPYISDPEMRFVIVGNRPHESLMKYVSDRVIITGFVDDVTPYLQHSLCLAAPLVLGAGVKIKIIEALSAGIPVLTNNIGIEGIDAEKGKHYFHCESPEDYIDIIQKLSSGEINNRRFAENEKAFVREKYDFNKSLVAFNEKLNLMYNAKP